MFSIIGVCMFGKNFKKREKYYFVIRTFIYYPQTKQPRDDTTTTTMKTISSILKALLSHESKPGKHATTNRIDSNTSIG